MLEQCHESARGQLVRNQSSKQCKYSLRLQLKIHVSWLLVVGQVVAFIIRSRTVKHCFRANIGLKGHAKSNMIYAACVNIVTGRRVQSVRKLNIRLSFDTYDTFIMPSVGSPNHAVANSDPSAPSKPFSISLPTKSRLVNAVTKPINPKKRPHSSLADDDSDHEDGFQQPQLVSAFDHSAGGAISTNGTDQGKQPLVIQGQKNRDWRADSYRKKGRDLMPADVQAAQKSQAQQNWAIVERDEVSKQFGLSFVKPDVKDADGTAETEEAHQSRYDTSTAEQEPQHMDQEALNALTGDGGLKPTLVLQSSSANGEGNTWMEPVNEDEAFRLDMASRPESADLDGYAAMPVEGFGAAYLRGNGWKDGDVVGKRKGEVVKPRDPERRPALLGIGAKEVPGSVEELGAWGKATKGKRKVDKAYHPVLLKNSVTGEMLTEEELEAKTDDQRKEEQDWRERRDRNLTKDEERKSQRRLEDSRKDPHRDGSRRDRSRSAEFSRHSSSRRVMSRSAERSRHSSSRHSSSGRHRSRSSDRRNSRQKDYDDYDEHERRDKDRRRRAKVDKYDDYDGNDRMGEDRRRRDKYDEQDDYRSLKALHRRREN